MALLAALVLASCGEGEDANLLPGATAEEITANLDTVQRLADQGECAGAEEAADQVSAQVEALRGVDRALVRALERGAARLEEVVVTCEETSAGDFETTVPDELPSEDEEEEREKEEKALEREEAEREKEEEKAEEERRKEEEKAEEEAPGPSEVPPPQSNGEGNGPEEGRAEEPSGGIGPSDPVEGEE